LVLWRALLAVAKPLPLPLDIARGVLRNGWIRFANDLRIGRKLPTIREKEVDSKILPTKATESESIKAIRSINFHLNDRITL
jgi:hypothetical protein